MSDRKLLEMAAKAAGLGPLTVEKGLFGVIRYFYCEKDYPSGTHWNPLADDGDALRLAVKLRMHVEVREDFVQIFCEDFGRIEDFEQEIDACAATRRAIVRAAAEIGRALP